jgi:hypothetical protein
VIDDPKKEFTKIAEQFKEESFDFVNKLCELKDNFQRLIKMLPEE